MKAPEQSQYLHRILLVVTGESPQVVTETIYALAKLGSQLVPTHLIVLTTGVGKQCVLDAFFPAGKTDGKFKQLCSELALRDIVFSQASIRVPLGKDGMQIEDAHSAEELMRMADLMLSTLLEFASEDSAIHMSLAGGRKTMSFYAGQAMSLIARPQDRLSHVVLSDKRFEFHPDFFFPPKTPVMLEVRDRHSGRVEKVSTLGVEVRITGVPFLRLREILGKKALVDVSNPRRLSELIEEANVALREPGEAVVEIDTREGKVWCNGRTIPFAQVELAFYYALAALAEEDRGLTRRADDAECLEYLELRSHITEEGLTLRKMGKYETTVQPRRERKRRRPAHS